MESIKLKVKRLPHCKALPTYATAGSAGPSIYVPPSSDLSLCKGANAQKSTGLILEVPPGYEAQVRPRSGLADKAGISLTNCVGTIDSDYRGEIILLVINHSIQPYTFEPGERIAQLVLSPVPRVEVVEVEELSQSQRGQKGFGSTGKTVWTSDYRGEP